jgi:cytochrome P450
MPKLAADPSSLTLLDAELQSDPYAYYEWLHAAHPVYRMPDSGFYLVSKYDDVRYVLTHPDLFSNQVRLGAIQGDGYQRYQSILKQRGWEHFEVLQRTDPPVHTRYRSILEQAFTARRVRELAPRIDALAAELVESWADDGECEFVDQFCLPLPGIIVAEQLGLDRRDIAKFKRWAAAMQSLQVRKLSDEELVQAAETELEVQHHVHAMIEDRRRHPQDDIVSVLVHSTFEDQPPLSEHELQAVMRQLINGGYETTTTALAHGLWLLIRYPEQQAKLRAEPKLLRKFVEEVLRFESPVQTLFRRATRDTKIAGIDIPEGAIISVRYGAANRDAAKFACPAQFDITRENSGANVAFGSGVHHCIGAPLARQEMWSSFPAILDRIEDIELAAPLPQPPHMHNFMNRLLLTLPIRFKRRRA